MNRQRVGTSLGKLRTDADLPIELVAGRAGTHPSYLRLVESGAARYVSPLYVCRVTRAIVELVQERATALAGDGVPR